MDIDAKDCRVDRFRAADESYWLHATHLPTGVSVETRSSAGPESKRWLVEKLEAAVNRHMNAELAEAPEEQPRHRVYFRLLASEARGSVVSFQDERARRKVREKMA